MLFVLWIVGCILTIVAGIMIRKEWKVKEIRRRDNYSYCYYIIPGKIVTYILAGIAIVFGLGIPAGYYIGKMIGWVRISSIIGGVVILILIIFAYLYVFVTEFSNIKEFIIFSIILLCAVIAFAFPGYKDAQYDKNIEVLEPSSGVAWSHDYELLSFNNILVQKISGEISGEFLVGSGDISGSLTTTDEISYWFINKENKGEYNSVSADICYIIPIEDDVTPHVKVVTYQETEKTIDHNTNEESVEVLSQWWEFEFYIPKSLLQ